MSKASVIFAEQFYYPDGWGGTQIPRDITIHLAQSGFEVCVVCGSDQYASLGGDPGPDPQTRGVRVLRLPRLFGGNIRSWKLLRQMWFYILAGPVLLTCGRPSVIVAQTNPPLLVPIAALVARLRRVPFVVIAQDIYPEVMFAHGMAKPDGMSGRLLACLFAWAYSRAAKVVALGEIAAQRLLRKGVQTDCIEVVSNWATGDESIERGHLNELRKEWNLENRFVILYSGNMGNAHDFDTPIAALRLVLKHSRDVTLVFIGEGSRLEDAKRAASDAGVLHAVQFRPLVPATRLPQSLGLAHVALVTLREGFEGLVVPSKLLGYMARGIPTIYVGPYSDVEQILVESGGGLCFRNGDAEALSCGIQSLIAGRDRLDVMGAAAARYYQSHLSRSKGLQKYAGLLNAVVQNSTR